jgi:tRNA A22 N-methylase
MQGHYIVDEESTGISIRTDEGLLADVGSKLMSSQLDQVSTNFRDNTTLVLRPSLLNYKLNHVVLQYSLISKAAVLELGKTHPVLVLHKLESGVMHGLKQ